MVPVVPIDDLTLTPDFVKIDVEGSEMGVLRGMMATIERCKPVFMIEFDPGQATGIADILRPFGYRPYVFDRHASAFRPYDGGEADNLFLFRPVCKALYPYYPSSEPRREFGPHASRGVSSAKSRLERRRRRGW